MLTRVRVRRVRRRRQAVRLAGDADDVRRVAAAGALGVVRVDRAAADRGHRVARRSPDSLSVSVWICTCMSSSSAGVAATRRSPPASRPSPRGSSGRSRRRGPARAAARRRTREPLPRKPKLSGKASAACSMRPRLTVPDEQMPTVTGPEAAAEHRRDARRDRLLAEAGASRSARARRSRRPWRSCPRPSARPCSRRPPCPGSTPSMSLRVAGLADADDAAVLDPDVGLHDARARRRSRATFVITKSSAPSAAVIAPCVPRPSRSVLPPPNTHSSPRHEQVLLDLAPRGRCRRAARGRRSSGRTAPRTRAREIRIAQRHPARPREAAARARAPSAAVRGSPPRRPSVRRLRPWTSRVAAERDELDLALVARLEPHRGAGRDVEPHPERRRRGRSERRG